MATVIRKLLLIAMLIGVLEFHPSAAAQTLQSRIQGTISNAQRTTLPGSHPQLARFSRDVGRVDPSLQLNGITLVFRPSDAQQQALAELLAAQQNPSSPLFHAWLTPEQFASRFGMSDEDIAKTEGWLEQQGFHIDAVSRSRDRINFSGSAAEVEQAFGVELHNFTLNGATYFAPASDLQLPSALATVTRTVTNLSSFRPHPQVRRPASAPVPAPQFTSAIDQSHYLTPGDIDTIYDITPAYNAGYTGSGQTIVVVGQSAVELSDIERFQTAAGLPVKDPTLTLVPNSGTSIVVSTDETESDLDLEYSGGVATGAAIHFVYVGSNPNYSVIDAEFYAVQNDLAPIISISYGLCEPELGEADYAAQNAVFQQAAAQGQTVIAAAGDNGSSDCAAEGVSGLAVDFPASSQYVTGVGGTEFPAADVSPLNTTYWETALAADIVSSARSYIPEQVWNNSTTSYMSAGGGGASVYTPRPSWQTEVPGIPSGSHRLVPDIALAASPDNPGYLYCSSDPETQVTGSCTNGFRDSTGLLYTVAGGTSFAAPIFAGMTAIVEQATAPSGETNTGLGLINARLYTLASNSSTYAQAFHDVTSGNNACVAGYQYCSSSAQGEYPAGTGYDEATGLGSVDLYNLLTAWTAGSSATAPAAPLASTTTLSAATRTPSTGASDAITIIVAPASTGVTTKPTGTVAVAVDGASSTTLTLSNGTAGYTFSSTTPGSHTVTATYSGDAVYAASSGSITLTVLKPTFTISAPPVTVTSGSSASSTITLFPANGYTGTIHWSLTLPASLTNVCYSIADTYVSGSGPATAVLTLYTNASSCQNLTTPSRRGSGSAKVTGVAARSHHSPGLASIAWATLCLLIAPACRRRRLSRFAMLALVLSLAPLAMLSGCTVENTTPAGSQTSSSDVDAPVGAYTLTLTGQDNTASSLSASTNLTVTIQ